MLLESIVHLLVSAGKGFPEASQQSRGLLIYEEERENGGFRLESCCLAWLSQATLLNSPELAVVPALLPQSCLVSLMYHLFLSLCSQSPRAKPRVVWQWWSGLSYPSARWERHFEFKLLVWLLWDALVLNPLLAASAISSCSLGAERWWHLWSCF